MVAHSSSTTDPQTVTHRRLTVVTCQDNLLTFGGSWFLHKFPAILETVPEYGTVILATDVPFDNVCAYDHTELMERSGPNDLGIKQIVLHGAYYHTANAAALLTIELQPTGRTVHILTGSLMTSMKRTYWERYHNQEIGWYYGLSLVLGLESSAGNHLTNKNLMYSLMLGKVTSVHFDQIVIHDEPFHVDGGAWQSFILKDK